MIDERLHNDYFALGRLDQRGGSMYFQLGYGAWIRRFGTHGLQVEDLIELRPPEQAVTTYPDFVPEAWARHWPAEEIWVVRKRAER